MVFQCINIRQVPWEMLKTAAFRLGFQHLPRDLANVNALKPCLIPKISLRKIHGLLTLTRAVGVQERRIIFLLLVTTKRGRMCSRPD